MWARVASGNVASKTGGISFNLVFFVLVFFFFLERMCVCMTTQAAASVLKRTLICLLTPVMELLPTYSDTGQPAGVQ